MHFWLVVHVVPAGSDFYPSRHDRGTVGHDYGLTRQPAWA
ncbi:hypothetical protein FHR20_004171 [Sphingomonas leidyi]|nr:hypothetical protein [Sphingomonas sp. JUb134]NIJ67189.1 hypothetical protein [Sphingomonas leidyi]NJB98834.1 hypothetical protein [Sphingomonas trueperi]